MKKKMRKRGKAVIGAVVLALGVSVVNIGGSLFEAVTNNVEPAQALEINKPNEIEVDLDRPSYDVEYKAKFDAEVRAEEEKELSKTLAEQEAKQSGK